MEIEKKKFIPKTKPLVTAFRLPKLKSFNVLAYYIATIKTLIAENAIPKLTNDRVKIFAETSICCENELAIKLTIHFTGGSGGNNDEYRYTNIIEFWSDEFICVDENGDWFNATEDELKEEFLEYVD